MKKYFIIPFLLWGMASFAQQKIENLDFETTENNSPALWKLMGNNSAKVFSDFNEKQQGKASAVIESEGTEGFRAIMYTLPNNYAGRKITLSGYLKTENVTDGFAGLWMRIDPDVAFNNMQNIGLKGTNDWKKYEVTLNMSPENTQQIVIGALLSGKGKIWVDNLKVSIDGKDIDHAKIFEKKLTKVELDKEFDKGSKISNISLNQNNIENLKKLGLIWGYLKYYHPGVAEGNYNWDYELFRIYKKTENAAAEERDQILTDWIKGLGKFQTAKNSEPKNVKIKPDLDWITNSGFSKELTELLLQLKDAKRPKVNYYVDFFPNVDNPDFRHENPYREMKYPDEGFRLLSLYRYWNMIQYYFPYKNLIEEDWKGVLKEFIPKFINAKDETEYNLASLELIGRIHDTHANIWGNSKSLEKYFGERYSPVQLTFAENKPVVEDFYDEKLGTQTGLKKGDVITEINGENVDAIIKRSLKYLPASNYPTQLRDISRKLLRSNAETISLTILRDGKTEEKTIKTYAYSDIKIKKEPKEFFKMLDGNIAYVYMGSVNADLLPEVFEKIKNTKGLVIDFRSYPSDFVVFKMGKLLKPEPLDFVKFTNTNNSQPGLFTFTPSLKTQGTGKKYYQGKIAILINETTQSSAEYHTMAFRTAPNAKVFGSTTAGADGNVSDIKLPGNISTMISGIGIYYPDGKETQRIGIVPDVEVKPTIDGIKNNKDEVLEKATKWINN
ncbi:S41 family peptidase [Chryseobacterium gambrini]|uniref:S41 family peptidase n=1 Tax=Chryseobacterium gambrini TaxID=373672 RepID=A0AAJ1R545_9FLAO|nr:MULTISPECIES: S41 family peptidase [Chryseobacterium]MDN4011813.1 S41 family peptidase [Chryseobacterium gambrini]MDN4029482.1 S41 family peptidase [Chryseobacterium gambrini]QWA40693.1 peptidase S41 [Chryseobacterium sp. ZHDP1]